MANIPPTQPVRQTQSIPALNQPMTIHIDDLIPGRKYSYTTTTPTGLVYGYEGIFYKQILDHNNRPQYLFKDVYARGVNNIYLGQKTI